MALTAFLALGTPLFWCAILGDVWLVAHVSAVCFTLLALVELSGQRRGWVVALFAAAAAMSRYPLLPLLFVYPALIAKSPTRVRDLMSYAFTLAPIFAIWICYNEVRWGTLNDIGFQLFYRLNYHGRSASMLDIGNIRSQLWNFFVHPPVAYGRRPWIGADQFGLALTYTSPALLCAFFARRPRLWVVMLWILAICAAIPSFLYYDGGGVQFGMRHALDFEPFLFALMITAIGRRTVPAALLLISWSVLVGIWGLWYWMAYPPGRSV
jgi:hypothetical protein